MTPKEFAQRCVQGNQHTNGIAGLLIPMGREAAEAKIEAEIRAAIALERHAITKIVEDVCGSQEETAWAIIKKIRAREIKD
jgi:hypothetical protein